MSDYYPLAGDTVDLPNNAVDSTVPLQSHDGGRVVKVVEADWEHRARVAAEGAETLSGVTELLADIAANNYFGMCVEGLAMHSVLSTAIQGWRDQLTQQSKALANLSVSCSAANTALTVSDSTASREISI